MLVGYSTAPGQAAADGAGNNGPYASALAAELAKPGLDALLVFANVQRSVWSTTHQDPWINHPTLPETYFAGRARQDTEKRDEALFLVKRASIDELRGHSEDAANLYDRAIDLLSDGGWADDKSMASALNGLAFHYIRQKRYVRALPLLQRSLTIYRRSVGDTHPAVQAIVKELSEIRKFIDQQTP
jgi:tetratricopeptide (TPR) repeat protein